MSQLKTRTSARSLSSLRRAVRIKRFAIGALAVIGVSAGYLATAPKIDASRALPAVASLERMAVPSIESQPTNAADETVAELATNGHAAATTTMIIESDLPVPVAEASETRWFNGRPVRPARTITMLVTAYSPDARSCGDSADGITASGYSVWTNGMKMVAADTGILPLGSLVSVPGYDEGGVVPVLDRGGKIKGERLDVLYPTHEVAMEWGAQRLEVTVWEYADGKPNGFKTNHRRRG